MRWRADGLAGKGITDDGLALLAGLPRLREVHLDGLPGVTLADTSVFPTRVRMKYAGEALDLAAERGRRQGRTGSDGRITKNS